MCAMISGLFIGSNDGRPPQAYKENIVSLRKQNVTDTRTHTVGRTDNVKTVYPPTNTVCGGYNEYPQSMFLSKNKKIMYTPVNPSSTI